MRTSEWPKLHLYYDYCPVEDEEIIREVQERCAEIEESGGAWTTEQGAEISAIFCKSDDPWGLFRFVDERTGLSQVGYRTRDGREWFHILRQMRNQPGSGLLEGFPSRYS